MKVGINGGKRFILTFIVFSIIFCLVTSLLIFVGSKRQTESAGTEVSAEDDSSVVVIIDAGHGGEDGGASFDGVYEKDLNLAVAFALEEVLQANGIKTVMTRREDVLLYDKNSDYRGQKKIQDLATRRKIAEEHENSIFVSIHMNSFPEEKYRGLQVYYSKNDERSRALAEDIQSTVKVFLSPDNNRRAKMADSSIYLLDRLDCPAVMVECGFLSNAQERELLCQAEYRKAIALGIASSVMGLINLSEGN